MIGTSICITSNRLVKLQKAAEYMHISENELLSILLWKSRRLFGDKAVIGKTVDYQQNDTESNFVIHHINISETDYELSTGRRYLYKISVSFIFALAIDHCLPEIIHEWTKNIAKAKKNWEEYNTNFCLSSFHIDHFINEITEFWLISWPRE